MFEDVISSALHRWHEGKIAVENAIAVDHAALHVLFGLGLWLILCKLPPRVFSPAAAWIVVLAVALWNEGSDMWIDRWPDAARQHSESAVDLALTMAGPALLILLEWLRRRTRRQDPLG